MREFGMEVAMILWDGLFAVDPISLVDLGYHARPYPD